MAEFNRYWAEEALGEPYAPQDYSWMKSTHRAGLLLGGVTCVLTTGALLGAAVYHLIDPAPRISISSYEIDLAMAPPAAPAPSQPSNTGMSKNEPGSPVPADSPQIASAAPQKADSSHGAPAALPIIGSKADHPDKAAAARPAPVPATPQAATQLAAAASAPAAPDRIAPAAATSDKRPQAKSPDTTPSAKPEVDTRVGLSKAAESKPTDIASGEKLGIREILPDGIVMQNGRRVKNGSSLPNGEILMGTDATKGMAETDRRVLVLTP
jgi:hypothetical protein